MWKISSIFRSSHRKVMLPKLFYQKWDRFFKLIFAWCHRKLLFANNLFPTSFRHVETGFFVLKLELLFYFFCYNFLILNTNEFSSIYFSTHSKVLLPEPFYHKYDFFFKHHLARSYLKRLFAKNISSNSFNNLRVETRFFQQITWLTLTFVVFFFWNFNMWKISSFFRSSHRKLCYQNYFIKSEIGSLNSFSLDVTANFFSLTTFFLLVFVMSKLDFLCSNWSYYSIFFVIIS